MHISSRREWPVDRLLEWTSFCAEWSSTVATCAKTLPCFSTKSLKKFDANSRQSDSKTIKVRLNVNRVTGICDEDVLPNSWAAIDDVRIAYEQQVFGHRALLKTIQRRCYTARARALIALQLRAAILDIDGTRSRMLEAPNLNVGWSPCGTYLFYGDKEETISMVDGRTLKTLKVESLKQETNEFAFHPNGKFMFLAVGRGQLHIYNAVFTWTHLLVVVSETEGSEMEALDLVPAITSSVLEDHHLIVGVVVIVDPGTVPINSRGEKQCVHLRDAFLHDQLDPIYVAYNM